MIRMRVPNPVPYFVYSFPATPTFARRVYPRSARDANHLAYTGLTVGATL